MVHLSSNYVFPKVRSIALANAIGIPKANKIDIKLNIIHIHTLNPFHISTID
jgi:hypothetical protein